MNKQEFRQVLQDIENSGQNAAENEDWVEWGCATVRHIAKNLPEDAKVSMV